MSFLTIEGEAVFIQHNGASERPPEQIGRNSRAYSGQLRSQVRGYKRSWQFTTGHLTMAEYLSLISVIQGGYVTCSGDALGGATVECDVAAQDAPYVPDDDAPNEFVRVVTLTLTEV